MQDFGQTGEVTDLAAVDLFLRKLVQGAAVQGQAGRGEHRSPDTGAGSTVEIGVVQAKHDPAAYRMVEHFRPVCRQKQYSPVIIQQAEKNADNGRALEVLT